MNSQIPQEDSTAIIFCLFFFIVSIFTIYSNFKILHGKNAPQVLRVNYAWNIQSDVHTNAIVFIFLGLVCFGGSLFILWELWISRLSLINVYSFLIGAILGLTLFRNGILSILFFLPISSYYIYMRKYKISLLRKYLFYLLLSVLLFFILYVLSDQIGTSQHFEIKNLRLGALITLIPAIMIQLFIRKYRFNLLDKIEVYGMKYRRY